MNFHYYCLGLELLTAAYGILCAYRMFCGFGEPMDREWDTLGVFLGTFLSVFFTVPVIFIMGFSNWWLHIPTFLCVIRSVVIILKGV